MIAFSLSTFLITILNVGILFFVLRAVLFKRVTKFMAERSAKIRDAIEQSEKDKNQAKALLEQYEARLKSAGAEVEALLRSARESAGHEAEKIIAQGRETADNLVANARKQIEAEQEAAVAVFRKEAAGLVVAASARLLSRELRAEDNRKYAEFLLSGINSGKL
ncbi:MAG: ATP synthase F0 subunit B [Treponema sp.]|jgi:F-type H+-transporting ATPase subunit b|nr:ATP synthase F0 subunit B [Treponema sp.]